MSYFTEIFGEYQPIVVDIVENEVSKQVVCADWAYILNVLIFVIAMVSVLKLIRGVIIRA